MRNYGRLLIELAAVVPDGLVGCTSFAIQQMNPFATVADQTTVLQKEPLCCRKNHCAAVLHSAPLWWLPRLN
jgi:hypothetical protein